MLLICALLTLLAPPACVAQTALSPGTGQSVPLLNSAAGHVAPAGGCTVTITLSGGNGGNANTWLGGQGAQFNATFWSDGATPFFVGRGIL